VLKTASAVRVAAANILPNHGKSMKTPSHCAVADQDDVVQEIVWHHRGRRRSHNMAKHHEDDDAKENSNGEETQHVLAEFAYIITRPTSFLKDGPSIKKVSASKSVSANRKRLLYALVVQVI
jgi:hypothetical protein